MSVQVNIPQGNNAEQSSTDERKFTRLGWLVIGIGLVGFFMWASLAPLDKGVASPGSVTVSGNRKTIQSPAGGVVRKIDVKEGDKVKAGEVLVQMSQVQAQAQVDSLKDQYYTTLATEGRLLAERDNLSKIRISPVFDTLKDDPRVAEIIALQVQLFSSRQQALRSEVDGFKQSIDGIRFQLKGLQDSRANKQIQLGSIREQMSSMKQLAAEGYLARNRYLEALTKR